MTWQYFWQSHLEQYIFTRLEKQNSKKKKKGKEKKTMTSDVFNA